MNKTEKISFDKKHPKTWNVLIQILGIILFILFVYYVMFAKHGWGF
jgi:hypothetical protein